VSNKKKHVVKLDPKSEVGFSGLPFEFERQIKSLDLKFDEISCTPFEILMMVNFLVTEGFSKMQNKKTLYNKMS
jgi:serine/threonine protein kinase